MCIEDIMISRRSYTVRTPITAGSPTRFPANPDRLSLTVGLQIDPAGTVVIATTEVDANNGRGIVGGTTPGALLSTSYTNAELTVDYKRHGAIVWGELWVMPTDADNVVVEVLMQDDLANEVREKLKEVRGRYAR